LVCLKAANDGEGNGRDVGAHSMLNQV
jgi:hypothetical protein